jgi:hypothetical protein
MEKYFCHFRNIIKHKYYVSIECFKLGLYWQGITHDLSKFSPIEFLESAKYYQGNGTPITEIKRRKGFSEAWLHHKGRNKHHWEYWTDFYEGVVKPIKIPDKYLKEMACDMLGASKTYLGWFFYDSAPLEYFDAHIDKCLMLDGDKKRMREILVAIITLMR